MKLNDNKIKIFFGDKGCTSTSANYIANLIKEILTKDKKFLDNISFVNSKVSSLNSDSKEATLSKGMSKFDLESIPDKVENIANLNALSSWLREAIKAKDEYLNNIQALAFSDFMENEYPEINKELINLQLEEAKILRDKWDESYVLYNLFSIKELNEYFTALSYASAYGKIIHVDNPFNKARKQLYEKIQKPTYLSLSDENIIYTSTPSVEPKEVDEVFITMQSKHREYEKTLNSFQFKIKEIIYKHEQENNLKAQEINQKVDSLKKTYISLYKKYKEDKTNEIAKLKVVIPNDLKELFEELNNMK